VPREFRFGECLWCDPCRLHPCQGLAVTTSFQVCFAVSAVGFFPM
jgi:hypothetical protein